jgi:TRAP transporter TAXI family solute receptor
VASIRDLATSVPIQMVAVPADLIQKLGSPYVAKMIPAGTYDGQTADVPTVAITNILVTRSDVSDEEAYQMTKQLFENLPDVVAAHKAASDIKLADAVKDMPIPMHPGAEKYYKEKGVM